MRPIAARVVTVAILLGASFSAVAGAADLKVGDRAPAFELPGSNGATYRLSDFEGKRVVVLAWFPKAFTGG